MAKTALIIDDAEFMRAMLKDILKEMGMKVVGEAADGAQGILEYQRVKPDLVMLDTTLPDTDGLNILQDLLALDPEAQIVMITPLGQRDHVLAAIKNGARDFIIKPFDEPRVIATLQHILQGQPA